MIDLFSEETSGIAKKRGFLSALTSLRLFAREAKLTNTFDTAEKLGVVSNQTRRRVNQPKTPTTATVDEFLRAEKPPYEWFRIRTALYNFRPFFVGQRQEAPINLLAAVDDWRNFA